MRFNVRKQPVKIVSADQNFTNELIRCKRLQSCETTGCTCYKHAFGTFLSTGTVKMELQSPGITEERKNQSGKKRHLRDVVLGRRGRAGRL